jgi:parallel beta helix pectate lyase-like protein
VSWRAVLLAAVLFTAGCRTKDERWLRDALAAGGRVALPPVQIDVSSEIVIPKGARDLDVAGAGARSILAAAPGFRGRAVLVLEKGARVRFYDFRISGPRHAPQPPQGLPPSHLPFARFTQSSGLLILESEDVSVERVVFDCIPGFAVLATASAGVRIDRVRVSDSGSRNAAGRNNTTGGILLEEGVAGFLVRNSEFRNVLGNGVWTHSLYTSARNGPGTIEENRFERIGRDAIQVGHATQVKVERNTGQEIGFPTDAVDVEGRAYPVGIDTAGNVDLSVYAGNRFEEINGKCIDLDGFHHGEVRGNVCINRRPPEQFPNGNYGIVMNNTNPDMQSEAIVMEENVIDGPHFGGIFVIGSGHRIAGNRLRRLNRAHCNEEAVKFGCYYPPGEPDMLRAGIYLGRGAERPAPAHGNRIEDNEISGFHMRDRCVASAPGIRQDANLVRANRCSE